MDAPRQAITGTDANKRGPYKKRGESTCVAVSSASMETEPPLCEQCGIRPAVKRRAFIEHRGHHPDDYRPHWVCRHCIWRGHIFGLIALALLIATGLFLFLLLQ